MAINRDPAEWFVSPDHWMDIEYGICQAKNEWLVLKRERGSNGSTRIERIARAPTREGAIGFLKLLKEK